MKVGTLLLALFLSLTPLVAQQPGSVSGKVSNAVTGQAVKKAVVTLRNTTGQNSYVAGTDPSGKFLFDSVPPGTYIATAMANGYSATMQSTGKPIAVVAQQVVEDVEVRIPPLAAISGKVLDEDGQPMAGVSVSAMRYVYRTLGKSLWSESSAQTDDRGQYRLFDMQPGRYYLMAVARGGTRMEQGPNVHSNIPEEGYPPVYYPGIAELSQTPPQELQPGVEWSGADFKLRRLPTYHIRGRVTGATPRSRGGGVNAWPCDQDQPAAMISGALRMSQLTNSRFDISGAVSGTYCLHMQGGTTSVTVKGADVDDVELTVPPSFAVTGVVIVDGAPPSPMPQINIELHSSSTQESTQSVMKNDGSFQIEGVYPGAYSLITQQQGPLYIKAILYGSQDVTNGLIPSAQAGAALHITMGTDPGEIDGTVQAGNVQSGMPVFIAALPEDAYAERQDMQRFGTSAVGGSFTLMNVPPGNYKVFAMQPDDPGDMNNHDLMKLLEGSATSVTVHAAGREQVSVTAISSNEVERARGKLK